MSVNDHKPVESVSINSITPAENAEHVAEVAHSESSKLDTIIWIVSIALLVASTLVNQYLPRYWSAASSLYVRIAVVFIMIVVALVGIYSTRQGKRFVHLVRDSRIELRRITWPSKSETVKTTWFVVTIVFVMSILLWLLDMFFGFLIKLIVG